MTKLVQTGLVFLGVLAAQFAPAQEDALHKREVPYVATPQVTVDEMLRLAAVGPEDFIIDLGSGDGRIVVTAAKKFGARGLGVDIDWRLVNQAEENARQAGVADRARFLEQDLFQADLGQATVITAYLLPFVMLKLRPKLLALKPGTRIVSHDFDFGDWPPDRKTSVRKNVYLWIVPAQAAGRWLARLELPPIERLFELEIKQRYQEVSAHARLNGVPSPVWETKLVGDRLSFVVVDATDRDDEASFYFDGRVSSDVIEGELARGVGAGRSVTRWRAVRVGQ
ncbi:MAG TPA: class I SAM-dependent methyltransferase [Burkholderiales bacterium]|nr:class I SAM-dependent methyltransferase [Burkholderiales bacterium]